MHNKHLVSIKYILTPLNYSETISITTGLNGAIINEGVDRYKALSSKHLEPITQGTKD